MLNESRLDLDDPDRLRVEFFGLLAKLCSERVDVGLESSVFRHQAIEVRTRRRSLSSQGGVHPNADAFRVQQNVWIFFDVWNHYGLPSWVCDQITTLVFSDASGVNALSILVCGYKCSYH